MFSVFVDPLTIDNLTNIKSIYSYNQASKAAVISFFETLRVELGSEVGVTIVTPGATESEMTKGKFLMPDGKVKVDQEMRDVSPSFQVFNL